MQIDPQVPAQSGFEHPDVDNHFTEVLIAASQSEARAMITGFPSRIAIIERGRPRSVLFQCPCGCGDVVVVNLDRSVDRAWRLRIRSGRVTLMPSVWRTTGCRSHFVLWNNRIWWCKLGEDQEEEWPEDMEAELLEEWRRIRAGSRRE